MYHALASKHFIIWREKHQLLAIYLVFPQLITHINTISKIIICDLRNYFGVQDGLNGGTLDSDAGNENSDYEDQPDEDIAQQVRTMI